MTGSVLEISFFVKTGTREQASFPRQKWMYDHNHIKTYASYNIY